MGKTQNQFNLQIISLYGEINALSLPQLDMSIGSSHHRNFVIDLRDVLKLDSAGMAWIVKIFKAARKLGGQAILVWSQNDAANRMIHLTQFDKIFTMADDVETAIALL